VIVDRLTSDLTGICGKEAPCPLIRALFNTIGKKTKEELE